MRKQQLAPPLSQGQQLQHPPLLLLLWLQLRQQALL
jgi:hypothetical protein